MSAGGRPGRRHVVVMIDGIDDLGGAETLAVELALRLDPERYERTLCITRWADHYETEQRVRSLLDRLRSSGVRILGIERTARWMVWPWLRLVRFLRRERVDVIHAHMFGSNVWAVALGRMTRVPAIVSHEHMWSFEGGVGRAVIDRDLIARHSDAFIAVSETTRKLMIERERIAPGDVIFIPNGVAELPAGERDRARAGLGLGADDLVVSTVAVLRPEKALEVLIWAAAILARSSPRLRVMIAGEGPERPRLERMVADLGLGSVVTLLGYRDDIPDLLAATDVAVCCSDYEGGPLSVLEYMDAGLGIVATRVGGLPELIEDGVSGVLVDRRDPDALAAAISALLDDPDRRAELGAAAREKKRSRYAISAWVGEIERLYDTLPQRS